MPDRPTAPSSPSSWPGPAGCPNGYLPHVTVARARSARAWPPADSALHRHRGPWWCPGEVRLVHSSLTPVAAAVPSGAPRDPGRAAEQPAGNLVVWVRLQSVVAGTVSPAR